MIETSSAEVLKATLQTMACMSVGSIDNSWKARAGATDKLAADLKGERGLAWQRCPEWVSLHPSCDSCACSGDQPNTLSLVDAFVVGMIQLSLSLRPCGSMARSRVCVRRAVA